MKPLSKTILDGLTYPDLSGRRQLRSHTVISLAILILLGLTSTFILFKKMQMMSRVQATPVPVQVIEPTVVPLTSTPIAETYEPGCPTNAADWSLSDPVIPQNYKIIQPACVYKGLEKTIAWTLAVREGHSRAEATELLGFDEMPMRQLNRVKIRGANGILEVPVSFIPPNPDFAEWRIDVNGNPAVTYALRGCFRTSTVEGNRLDVWGGNYPVICMVVEDAENTHIIYSLDQHKYASSATAMRSYLLFGYVSDGNWVWLGIQSNPKQPITDPSATANERLTIATLYDSQPWDANWLAREYHLDMQPLPKNWRSLNDEQEKQFILDELSKTMETVQP